MKWGYLFTCHFCNKQLWKTRKEARKQMKRAHPGESGLNVYECPIYTGWHYGNLPPEGRDKARERLNWKLERSNHDQRSSRQYEDDARQCP